jgi:hypothetical protein
MNASTVLLKAYIIEDAGGADAFLALVHGANAGGCKKPTGANAVRFLGFSAERITASGRAISVAKHGIARATAGGTIARGDRLIIGGVDGKVTSAEALIAAGPGIAATFNVVGTAEDSAVAGDVFPVWVAPSTVIVPAS